MDITVSVSPAAVKAGSPVTFTIHARGPDKDCCLFQTVYGDGGESPSIDCPPPITGGSTTVNFTHTYNKAGPHRMLVQALSAQCDHHAVMYITVDVGAGPAAAQGPDLPTVTFDSSTAVSPNPGNASVTLFARATDNDGHLTKFVVDFGDGTTKTFPGDVYKCVPGPDGWPGPSSAELPGGRNPPEHHYDQPGTYTLKLTAFSYGCDGTDEQRATGTFNWMVTNP